MRFIIFLYALWLALQPSVALALPNSITLVADTWCPYNCNPASNKPGYVVEIAKAVFESKGIEVKYQVTPWARALKDTKHGKYDAVIGATLGEAKGFVFPKSPIGISRYRFFTTPESTWKFSNLEALHSVVLGVVEGYQYDESIDRFIEKHKNHREHIQVVGGDTATQQNIKKLLAGRIDVMLEDANVVRSTLKAMELKKSLRDAGGPATLTKEEEWLFVAFSPKHKDSPALATILHEGIQTLRKNGELKNILERYNVEDWKQ